MPNEGIEPPSSEYKTEIISHYTNSAKYSFLIADGLLPSNSRVQTGRSIFEYEL